MLRQKNPGGPAGPYVAMTRGLLLSGLGGRLAAAGAAGAAGLPAGGAGAAAAGLRIFIMHS